MTRMTDKHLHEFLTAWRQNPTLPLEVARAQYDVPSPRSWEVMYYETPTCSVPIAEFTEWNEAQEWADTNAHWAAERGAKPRRWRLTYRPDGSWGGFGYYGPDDQPVNDAERLAVTEHVDQTCFTDADMDNLALLLRSGYDITGRFA